MEPKKQSKYTVKTDEHTYIVSFDSLSNPLAKEAIAEIKQNTVGKVLSESLEIDSNSSIGTVNINTQGSKGVFSTFATMLASVVYLMKRTGRTAAACKSALVEAKWSVDEAFNILSKNKPGTDG